MLPQVGQQAALEDEKVKKSNGKPLLLDVAEAKALSEEARRRNIELAALIRQTGPVAVYGDLQESVGKKVDALAAPPYQRPDILEEVTEKLVDAAHHDPMLKRWFS